MTPQDAEGDNSGINASAAEIHIVTTSKNVVTDTVSHRRLALPVLRVRVHDLFKQDGRLKEEKEDNYTRYILRRNPVRAEEIRKNRNERIEKIKTFVQEKKRILARTSKSKS